jgi:hypothetical protein
MHTVLTRFKIFRAPDVALIRGWRSIGGAALKRVNTVSTKNEDGGHFIPFDQNICRSKQDIKKR